MKRDEHRIAELHAAVNARDIDAITACYDPAARFVDGLEGGMLDGLEAIRAYFIRLLDTIRVVVALIDLDREPDGRLRALLQVEARGPHGGLWEDQTVSVSYRLERGLIVAQDVKDSVRFGRRA